MEIMEGIHQVDGVNANVYPVIDGEELTLVDTGMPKSAEKILGYIRKINRQPSNISKILLIVLLKKWQRRQRKTPKPKNSPSVA